MKKDELKENKTIDLDSRLDEIIDWINTTISELNIELRKLLHEKGE